MRKKLLSEAQVRRFQSLASIKPLNEMDSSYDRDDEGEAMEEDMAYQKEDDKMEALYEEEDDMDLDAGDDMDDEEGGDSDVELDEELVEKFMDAAETIQELASALGGAGGDMDMGMDDEPADDLDMGGEEKPADDLGMDMGMDDEGGEDEEDEEAMLQEALRGISYVPSQKEVVKTVAKRVARRLQEAKRAEARLNRALGKRR